jgi:hypothetical protein
MDFPEPPRDNIYSTPPDRAEKAQLHYIVVQVSARKYAVAEYDNKTGGILGFRLCTSPMNFLQASDKAKELRDQRVKPSQT